MRQSRFSLLALCLVAQPVIAESVTAQRVFGPDAPCFGRFYDSAHLARHPDQQVTGIVLFADTEDMELDTTDQSLVVVEVTTRSGKTPYSGIGICIDGNRGLFCSMEGDAGGFTVSAFDDRLLLEVRDVGMSFEGPTDFLTLEYDHGDDRAFLLDRGVCPS